MEIDNILYKVLTAKELQESLNKKYNVEYISTKKYVLSSKSDSYIYKRHIAYD